MKIEMLKAEAKDYKERYECKTDALNAALMAIDFATKENERYREALERVALLNNMNTMTGKIARVALGERV